MVKAILNYEKNVPIPNIKRENSSREYVFVYLVDFIKEKGDTIIKINRNSNGIYQNVDYYGVYMVEGKTPVVITDNDSLSKNFIRIKIKNNLLNKYRIEDYKSHYDESPPVYTYKIKKNTVNLISIDTISYNWLGK